MKKRIIAVVVLIAVLATFLSGCSLFEKDEYRDGQQVIATVSYKGLTAELTKSELSEYFMTNGYTYVTQYNMSLDTVMEYFKEALVNSKLALLKARVDIAEKQGKDINTPIEQLLTKAELKYVIEKTNETFQTSYDDLIAEIEDEIELSNPTEDEDEEEVDDDSDETASLTPRPVKKKDETEEYDPYEEITGDLPAKFFETLNPTTKIGKEAKKRLLKNLESSYRDYDYYYNKQAESVLITKYKREMIEEKISITDEMILTRWNELIVKDLLSYSGKEDAYKTAIEKGSSTTYVHDFKTYGYVQNIVIKFTSDQQEMIKNYSFANDAAKQEFYNSLVSKITTNISNPDYDADADCTGFVKDADGNATDVKYDKTTDKFPIDHNCSDPNCVCRPYLEGSDYRDVNVMTILDKMSTDLAQDTTIGKLKAFDDWFYKVNDDSESMFNNKVGYFITADDEESSYVESFTSLARALIKKGVGAYSLTDSEIAAIYPDGNPAIFNYNGITYAVSNYGIHILMVCGVNKTEGKTVLVDDNGNVVTAPIEGKKYHNATSLDAIVDQYTGQTLRENISETLKTELTADKYSYDSVELYTQTKDSIEYNDKVYNKLMDELKEALGL